MMDNAEIAIAEPRLPVVIAGVGSAREADACKSTNPCTAHKYWEAVSRDFPHLDLRSRSALFGIYELHLPPEHLQLQAQYTSVPCVPYADLPARMSSQMSSSSLVSLSRKVRGPA